MKLKNVIWSVASQDFIAISTLVKILNKSSTAMKTGIGINFYSISQLSTSMHKLMITVILQRRKKEKSIFFVIIYKKIDCVKKIWVFCKLTKFLIIWLLYNKTLPAILHSEISLYLNTFRESQFNLCSKVTQKLSIRPSYNRNVK